ncbi:hypothetical protein [Anaerotruncus rubiinfantis]|uniref:hypothetical protein n=1 Tax=Anaerotruncus rubiinfantis TaxID=1720200 RepID=UPI00189823AB|nr:hypothetical protein [Anaerotruncus rubiinfantis]
MLNKTMYPAMPFSPQALSTQAIGAADTIIPVDNIDAFPAAPNLAVIGTDENAETICYAAKTDSALSGCVRGVEGTAKEWQAGEVIARNFTAADFDAVRQNIEGLDQGKADKVANATAGNLAGLDADGNPTNSGKKPDDFADKTHSHTNYALKAPSPTAGNLAALDVNGNPVDSGKAPDDFASSSDMAQKSDKSTLYERVLTAAGWSADTPPTQTVSIPKGTAASVNELLPGYPITDEQLAAYQVANLQDGGQTAGSATYQCRGEVPTIDIPARIIVRGDM